MQIQRQFQSGMSSSSTRQQRCGYSGRRNVTFGCLLYIHPNNYIFIRERKILHKVNQGPYLHFHGGMDKPSTVFQGTGA